MIYVDELEDIHPFISEWIDNLYPGYIDIDNEPKTNENYIDFEIDEDDLSGLHTNDLKKLFQDTEPSIINFMTYYLGLDYDIEVLGESDEIDNYMIVRLSFKGNKDERQRH